MNILFTAFNGKNNSSKTLLDNINVSENNKLYLKNSFETSVKQLENKIKKDNFDLIISFGQAPLKNDTIKIELQGNLEASYKTKCNYYDIKNKLEIKRYEVIVSSNAGNYLCNWIYYHGLKYINDNNLKCQMLFIHIPKKNNITNITNISNMFTEITELVNSKEWM